MDYKTLVPLIITIFLAFIGFIAKYVNDVIIAQRKDKLERINHQLKNLYGPLYAINEASEIAWKEFRSIYRPDAISFFGTVPPPTEEELIAWRLWMSEVFMPLNLRIEKAIVENGDLIIEKEMPKCFISLCAHVAAYKPVIKKWESGDYSEHVSLSNFPKDFRSYIKSSYMDLKEQQAKLCSSFK
jgi:hypothetical protein